MHEAADIVKRIEAALLREAEVQDLDLTVARQDDVLWLEIAVNDPLVGAAITGAANEATVGA